MYYGFLFWLIVLMSSRSRAMAQPDVAFGVEREHVIIPISDIPQRMSDEELYRHAMDVYFGDNGYKVRKVLEPYVKPKLSHAQTDIFKSQEDMIKIIMKLKRESSSSDSSEEESTHKDAIHDIIVSSLEEVLSHKQQQIDSFAHAFKSHLRDKKVIIALLGFGSTVIASGTALSLAFGSC